VAGIKFLKSILHFEFLRKENQPTGSISKCNAVLRKKVTSVLSTLLFNLAQLPFVSLPLWVEYFAPMNFQDLFSIMSDFSSMACIAVVTLAPWYSIAAQMTPPHWR